MPEPEAQTKARPPREPQALSSEYHKARKQLMLWSGILFVWSLIGIDLEKAKEAGGNTGALIKSIKSPQAVPWVLVIMVGYFAFKMRVEWRQCNERRRQVREARQDYYSACIVAGTACLLYFGQAVSKVRVADLLYDEHTKFSLASGIIFGMAVSSTIYRIVEYRSLRRRHGATIVWRWLRMQLAWRSFVILSSSLIFIFWGRQWSVFLPGAAIAAVFIAITHVLVSRRTTRWLGEPKR